MRWRYHEQFGDLDCNEYLPVSLAFPRVLLTPVARVTYPVTLVATTEGSAMGISIQETSLLPELRSCRGPN